MCQLPTSSPVILPLLENLISLQNLQTGQVDETAKPNENKLVSGINELRINYKSF